MINEGDVVKVKVEGIAHILWSVVQREYGKLKIVPITDPDGDIAVTTETVTVHPSYVDLVVRSDVTEQSVPQEVTFMSGWYEALSDERGKKVKELMTEVKSLMDRISNSNDAYLKSIEEANSVAELLKNLSSVAQHLNIKRNELDKLEVVTKERLGKMQHNDVVWVRLNAFDPMEEDFPYVEVDPDPNDDLGDTFKVFAKNAYRIKS